jgi:hypothetical protein
VNNINKHDNANMVMGLNSVTKSGTTLNHL